ncbi:MAG: RNA polymerase sigma-70 factor (ECF subfamily) [Crocinitomicaceae bacterium]|jgi:RNA polymerase sigma-70 factor (ECF subfamily)
MGCYAVKPFLNKDNLNQLYRFSMALTANSQNAEDLLHTGIERALRGNFSAVENKMAYIRTIIRNAWYDELRQKRTHNEVSSDFIDEDEENVEPTSLIELDPNNVMIQQIQLQRTWELLTDQQRELLYLWCILGMTAAEIAIELKLPRGTVLSKIHRLKSALYIHQKKQAQSVLNEVKYD